MMSAANYVGVKLTAIPMILSPGFVAAIIPHITSSLEEKNYRKMRRDIKECINIVLFIALFLSYCILLYAKPLFYSLYYTSDLDLAANSVQWIAVEGLFGTITPVITSLMMALRMRKELIRQMLINVIIKGILMVPMVMWWGIAGAVLSSVIAHSYLIGYCVRILYKKFKVSFSNTVRILICSAIGLILMTVVALILYKLGLGGTGTSKMICFVTMAINGLISASVFAAVEWFLGVPQVLFHIKPRKKQA
jgi:O-antigen/teichoic acid export membrane protein